MRLLFLAACAVVLSACGQQTAPETLPPEFELNYMQACRAAGQTVAHCSCIWDKIEADVPASEFVAFEGLPAAERAAHPLVQQLERYALECADQLQPPTEDPPAP